MKKIVRLTENDLTRIVKKVLKEQERKSWDLGNGETGYPYDPQLDRELNDLVGGVINGNISVDEFNKQKSKYFHTNSKVMLMTEEGGRTISWHNVPIDDFLLMADQEMFIGDLYKMEAYVKKGGKIIKLQIVAEPKSN